MAQFCAWFDLGHITPSSAQFNTEKLNWLNAQYIKTLPITEIAREIKLRLKALGVVYSEFPPLDDVLVLYRERANNLNQLAHDIAFFYQLPIHNSADVEKHINTESKGYLQAFVEQIQNLEWNAEKIHQAMADFVTTQQIKFPKLAMPLRVALTGIAQSPSIDQVMVLFGKQECLKRINAFLY